MLIYLATPYSHPSAAVRHSRFQVVNIVAAAMMARGLHVYSPISHTHPICLAGDLPQGWDYWAELDRKMVSACGLLVVVRQPGWRSSVGVKAEIEIAGELGIPVEHIQPSDVVRWSNARTDGASDGSETGTV